MSLTMSELSRNPGFFFFFLTKHFLCHLVSETSPRARGHYGATAFSGRGCLFLPHSVYTGPGYKSGLSLSSLLSFPELSPPIFPLKRKQTSKLQFLWVLRRFRLCHLLPLVISVISTSSDSYPSLKMLAPASLPFSPLPPCTSFWATSAPTRDIGLLVPRLLTPNGLVLYWLQPPAFGPLPSVPSWPLTASSLKPLPLLPHLLLSFWLDSCVLTPQWFLYSSGTSNPLTLLSMNTLHSSLPSLPTLDFRTCH